MIWQNYEKNGILERMQIIPSEMQEVIQGAWIEIAIATPTEVEWMVANLYLPPEFIKSVLDEEESSHVDTADDAKLEIILRERYLNCRNWEDIAIDLAYSQVYLYKLHQKAIKRIKVPQEYSKV